MARSAVVLTCIICTLVLAPRLCHGWSTLSGRLPMTPEESSMLEDLINWYGAGDKEQSISEIGPRRGPHPTHQFIVRQAYMLLQKDPAWADSPWKLPESDSVLAWDGIVRKTAEAGRHEGMWERTAPGTGAAAVFAPPRTRVGGPSADAELTADGKWNAEYNAAFHYWNPWLKCGSAPEAVGDRYAALVDAIVSGGGENAKAKAASHVCHYLSDMICPKHADMIALDKKTLEELSRFARGWFEEHQRTPTITLSQWLESPWVTEATNTIVRASKASLKSPYWKRVNANIGNNALLEPNDSWVRYGVDVAAPSLRASVAGFLGALRSRPADKDLERFYCFFDPFYYSGQLVMTYEKKGDWDPRSIPQFGLTNAASEHLMWETNPALGAFVINNADRMIRGETVENSYVALPGKPGLWSADGKLREAAYREAAAEFARGGSLLQHGKNPLAGDDFRRDNFDESLSLSVKYVFSLLRSCITAIRCDATYAYFPTEKKYRVYCDVGNAADETLNVRTIRISLAKDGELLSDSKWAKTVSCSVPKDGRQRVTVELPETVVTEKEPQFFVDVFGRYDKTPDLGFWRGQVSERPGRIMHGMSLPAFDRVTGALDLAIVFDVTGSMGSSINSMRDNAIDVLGKLSDRLGDLRVALVSFRDAKVDKEKAFSVTPFSSDISGVVTRMRGWKAEGGGDTPEDQLQAIRLALDMWAKTKNDPRKPTKIVVVITDAPPHDPDKWGNTQASIADYAERVDPAHIYPIIVGSRKSAQEKAEELARLTGGEVLSAKSGDEVASVLASAVDKAIATHGDGSGAGLPPAALFYGGFAGVLLGGVWMWRDIRGRRRD